MSTGRWNPAQDKTDDWVRRSQDEMSKMVWAQPSIKHSFYKNAYGEMYTLSPWRLVDYWTWTREPDPDDFVFADGQVRRKLSRTPSSCSWRTTRASSESVPSSWQRWTYSWIIIRKFIGLYASSS